VAGGEKIRAQFARIVDQVVKANMAVALNARVGRQSHTGAADVVVHHRALEGFLNVDQVEGDAKRSGNAACVVDAFQAAALVAGALTRAALGPQAHHDANTIVAHFHKQSRRDRTIDATTHGDDDGGLCYRLIVLAANAFTKDLRHVHSVPDCTRDRRSVPVEHAQRCVCRWPLQ